MADGIAPSRTIPELLADAASRDPDGVWIRTDEGSLTFGGARTQVAATAAALHSPECGTATWSWSPPGPPRRT